MAYVLKRRSFGQASTWIAFLVAVHGLLIIADTLQVQLHIHHIPLHLQPLTFIVDVPLLIGLILLSVSLYLRRRKFNAWVFATFLYVFLIGLNTNQLLSHRYNIFHIQTLTILIPLVVLVFLLLDRKEFVVRSDIRTFTNSVKITSIVLITAFLYGTFGFLLMHKSDFHQRISLVSAMHYTIDQFDLTTNPLQAYSRKATLFLNSLTFISISALGFAVVSLFQPLKAKYIRHKDQTDLARQLIKKYSIDSEDIFKIWPEDKNYFFSSNNKSGIAYKVQNKVALVVGDPFGQMSSTKGLFSRFDELCFVNDWRPAYIHATSKWKKLLEQHGYESQLIGQEAIIDVEHFVKTVAPKKYFREIKNRYMKLGYSSQLLEPPYGPEIMARLKTISDEWLNSPGKSERGFMMGFFKEAYLQQCKIFVVRDADGMIQAFLNLVPTYNQAELNFDLLRKSHNSPGNINDYLLTQLIDILNHQSCQRLNMGLCPLAGLGQAPNTLINRSLRFVYSNGDRFYSFRGLYRFKAKYQPTWRDRYVFYRGGVSDFSRVMRSLVKAMSL